MSTYQAGYKGPFINSAFAVELSNNGESGDDRTWLKAAPIVDVRNELIAVYIATNGDPSWIATFDLDGTCLVSALTEDAGAWTQAADDYNSGDEESLEETIADMLATAGLLK